MCPIRTPCAPHRPHFCPPSPHFPAQQPFCPLGTPLTPTASPPLPFLPPPDEEEEEEEESDEELPQELSLGGGVATGGAPRGHRCPRTPVLRGRPDGTDFSSTGAMDRDTFAPPYAAALQVQTPPR